MISGDCNLSKPSFSIRYGKYTNENLKRAIRSCYLLIFVEYRIDIFRDILSKYT